MAATSINIQPIKGSSEAHNFRLKELDYVQKELTHLNESISQDTIANRLENIKTRYTETTKQQMQKKATPIREGVIVIQDETTMEQLQSFAQDCETKFGFKAFQIHIHQDEGHRDTETQEWKPNLHAHMVFDWTDSNTGKSIKMNRQDMSELQTMCANSLEMDRGVSSDKQHLNAIQFKATETAKALAHVSVLIETKENTLKRLKIENKELQSKQAVAKTVSKTAEKIGDLLGMTKNDREKEKLKTQINALQQQIKASERKAEFNEHNLEVLNLKLNEEKSWNNSLKQNFDRGKQDLGKLTKEIGVLADMLPEDGLEWVKNNLPAIHKTITEEKRKNDLSQSSKRGFSM